MEIWALEGVWVTSERRHCEARKGVGARGRAKRPGRMRSVDVSEVECQVVLPWRNSSDLTIMVEFICAYNLEPPASLPALRQHSKPIGVAAALPSHATLAAATTSIGKAARVSKHIIVHVTLNCIYISHVLN